MEEDFASYYQSKRAEAMTPSDDGNEGQVQESNQDRSPRRRSADAESVYSNLASNDFQGRSRNSTARSSCCVVM